MVNFVKVEGNPSLVRDMRSNAILNTDKVAYLNYMKTKNKLLESKSQVEQNTDDINILKQDMAEIKQLLQLLVKSKED
jgi:hypothetical protein